MELTNRVWKEFSLTEVFTEIQRGKRLKKDDHIHGNMPYVSSTASNNGIDGFVAVSDTHLDVYKRQVLN